MIDATEGSGQPLIFNVNLDRLTSQNVTVTATVNAGPPQTWTATATHSLSAKVCDNSTGVIICT